MKNHQKICKKHPARPIKPDPAGFFLFFYFRAEKNLIKKIKKQTLIQILP